MSTRLNDATVELLLDIFSDSLKYLADAVEDVPASRMAEQPAGLVNHPAWTLAHLGAASGLLLTLLDDQGVPTANAEFAQYGPGTTPRPDPAAYPDKAELLARLSDRHARVADAVRAKHADYFHRPPPEKLRAFAPTIGRIASYLLAAHESYHLGQLMQWRRAAGLPAK